MIKKVLAIFLWLALNLTAQSPSAVQLLGIRVEFKEDNSELTTGNGKFDLSNSTAPYQIDPPPHNRRYFRNHIAAVGDYFNSVSNGKVAIDGEVFPAGENSSYQLELEMFHYNPNLGEEEANKGLARLFRDALLAAEADTAIHFNDFDAVVIFHAGVGKDIYFDYDLTPEDIPSIYITPDFLEKYLGQRTIELRNGSVSIGRGIILPETESQAGIQLALNGIFAANMASWFGLPDLFDTVEKTSVVGSFGLMDAGLFNFAGLLPARMTAWSRHFLGWEEPEEVLPGKSVTLQISSRQPGVPSTYKIPFSEEESFWIEHRWNGNVYHDSLRADASKNRDTLMTYREYLETFFSGKVRFDDVSGVLIHADNYDLGLPGSGLLIWRIDDGVIEENLLTNGVNSLPGIKGVSVVEADGSPDIGQQYTFLDAAYGSGLGYQLDFWYKDNSSPFYTNRFDAGSFPPAESQYGHGKSGVAFSSFSSLAETMTFKVEAEYYSSGYPKNFHTPVNCLYAGKDLFFLSEDSLWRFRDGVKTGAETNNSGLNGDNYTFYPGSPSLLLVNNDTSLWVWNYTDSGSPLFLEKLSFPDSIKQAVAGEGRFSVVTDDSLFEYRENSGNVIRVSGFPISDFSYVLYLGNERFILDSELDPLFADVNLFYHPLYEKSSAQWWVFGKNGEFRRFDRSFSHKLMAAELAIHVDNQPILAYNSGFGQSFPAACFISGEQIYAIDINGHSGENTPIRIENFGSSDGSEIRTGKLGGNTVFLARNIAGTIFPVKTDGKIEIALMINGPNSGYWLGTEGISSMLNDSVWTVWANGVSPGEWNGRGGSGIFGPYQIDLPVQNSTPAPLSVFAENSVYNWPNPNTGNYTFIRCRLNYSGTINLKIVDLAGELVLNASFDGVVGINEYRWDLSSVASGVYFARIEADTEKGSSARIIKIMVIK